MVDAKLLARVMADEKRREEAKSKLKIKRREVAADRREAVKIARKLMHPKMTLQEIRKKSTAVKRGWYE